MKIHGSKWKTLIPLIVAIVVMTGVFILISARSALLENETSRS